MSIGEWQNAELARAALKQMYVDKKFVIRTRDGGIRLHPNDFTQTNEADSRDSIDAYKLDFKTSINTLAETQKLLEALGYRFKDVKATARIGRVLSGPRIGNDYVEIIKPTTAEAQEFSAMLGLDETMKNYVLSDVSRANERREHSRSSAGASRG